MNKKYVGYYCPECEELIKEGYDCSCCYNKLGVMFSEKICKAIKSQWKKIYVDMKSKFKGDTILAEKEINEQFDRIMKATDNMEK